MPSPSRRGFLALPAELRLQIYSHITQSIGVPTSHNLRNHYGFLLSCWKVFHELKHAAIAAVRVFIAQVQEIWKRKEGNMPLHISRIKRLSDTIGIQIGVPADSYQMRQSNGKVYFRCTARLEPLLYSLVENLPSFAVYPAIFPLQVRHSLIPPLRSSSCAPEFIGPPGKAFWNAHGHLCNILNLVTIGHYRSFLKNTDVDSKRGVRMGVRHPYGMAEWDCAWDPVLAARGRRNWNCVGTARRLEEERGLRKLERVSYGNRLIHACDEFRP